MCYKIGLQIKLVLILLFVVAVTSACQTHGTEKRSTKCILPPYPNHGRYEVAGELAAKPGDELEYVYLNVSCSHGHGVIGNNVVLCILGEWSTTVPQCVPACYLQEHPSVKYSCKRPGVEEFSACSEYEPLKTIIKPECRPGYYSTADMPPMRCVDGAWTYEAKCTPAPCYLQEHPSVTYSCKRPGVEEFSACSEYEPLKTIIKPECRPGYYSTAAMPPMRCVDGAWTYEAKCTPGAECGRVTPEAVDLITDGRSAKRGVLPWHVGIYWKTTKPYRQICGGSLVTNKVVISVAHCFWNDISKQQPASMYAVAIGKSYRPWNDDRDVDAQKSDVKEIKIPVRFQGSAANFQDDIAVVILKTAFVYQMFVRPVCLDFDVNFDRRQLSAGNLGKFAGWDHTAGNRKASEIQKKVVELPYVDIEQCIEASPPGFREYITSDKICAGYENGTALCKGDTGGGLAFPESVNGTERYYLRGILSVAEYTENLCISSAQTLFTHITKHEHFVKEYL